ncbi:MAG: hypothetical protein FWH57_04980 [Oscillospiraceae bacterium]|nr:hypothetical protein [Oscillospiraceae bacterium]
MGNNEYGDELFIYSMSLKENMDEKSQAIDIADTAVVGGVSYSFQKIHMFDGSVSVIVPEQFVEMNEESAKLKYPSDYRPQCIYTNYNGALNIAFSLLDYPFDKNQIEEQISEWEMGIKQANPAYVFLTRKTEVLDVVKIGYFEYKSDAQDDKVYNFVFIISACKKLLLGVFNCPFEQHKDWRQLVVRMILSIKEKTSE